MNDLDEHGRPEPPPAAGEVDTLVGFLDFQCATLGWKCSGVDAAGLRATVGTSAMTLGGLLKHMAYVESEWFSLWLHGRDRRPPWNAVDWKADPDWDWHSAATDSPEQLRALWEGAVSASRSLVDEALADGGLEQLARRLARRSRTQPVLDPGAHDRGVRAPQRPRRPPARVPRRPDRRVSAAMPAITRGGDR